MPLTTYEQAKLCPKCERTGEVRDKIIPPKSAGLKPGTLIHMVYCTTKLCRWYNTPWQIQVNPDGSVPPPRNHAGEDKIYHQFEGHDERAKALIDQLRRQNEAETSSGGAEVRGNRIIKVEE